MFGPMPLAWYIEKLFEALEVAVGPDGSVKQEIGVGHGTMGVDTWRASFGAIYTGMGVNVDDPLRPHQASLFSVSGKRRDQDSGQLNSKGTSCRIFFLLTAGAKLHVCDSRRCGSLEWIYHLDLPQQIV